MQCILVDRPGALIKSILRFGWVLKRGERLLHCSQMNIKNVVNVVKNKYK